MNADYFRTLIDYSYWANHRVWRSLDALSDEQFTQPHDYSIGSVQRQAHHVMSVERLWLQRIRQIQVDPFAPLEQFPTWQVLCQAWSDVEADWRTYAAALTDADLAEMVTFTSITNGNTYTVPRWVCLSQNINHSTDHRAQILALVHQLGGQTEAQDILFYWWQKT